MIDFRIVSVAMFKVFTRAYYAVQTNDGGVIVYDDFSKLPPMVSDWMKARNDQEYTCEGMIIYDKPLQVSCTASGVENG